MVWKKRDPRALLSCGKDNQLIQHSFTDATHPAKHANPVGLAIDIRGNIALARSDKRVESLSSSYAASLTQTSQEIAVLNSDLVPPNVSQPQPVNLLHSKNFPTPTTAVFSRGNLVANAKRQMSLQLSAASTASTATCPNPSYAPSVPANPPPSCSIASSPTSSAMQQHIQQLHEQQKPSQTYHQSMMQNMSLVGAGIVSSTVSAFMPSNANQPVVPPGKSRPNIFTTFGVPKSPAKWQVQIKPSGIVINLRYCVLSSSFTSTLSSKSSTCNVIVAIRFKFENFIWLQFRGVHW